MFALVEDATIIGVTNLIVNGITLVALTYIAARYREDK